MYACMCDVCIYVYIVYLCAMCMDVCIYVCMKTLDIVTLYIITTSQKHCIVVLVMQYVAVLQFYQ